MRLKNIQFFQLNKHTWLASGWIVDIIQIQEKNDIQKKAVRSLLDKLVEHLSLCKKLDESSYPYQLINTQKFVCFTHSNQQVAVIISRKKSGVDIELKDIPQAVINRYYHQNEVAYLLTKTKKEQAVLSRWLWQYKECMVKIKQCTLAQSLGVNNLDVLQQIESNLTNSDHLITIVNQVSSFGKVKDSKQNIWLNKQQGILAVYND